MRTVASTKPSHEVQTEVQYLLVKERRNNYYSLPGGGYKKGESSVTAACRELREELGIKPISPERRRDVDYEGKYCLHKIVVVGKFEGQIKISSSELKSYTWYSEGDHTDISPTTKGIIKKFENSNW